MAVELIGNDYLSCGGEVWRAVLALGRSYGWEPMGTEPADSSRVAWEKFGRFENDYKPDSWQYAKRFEAEDAARLADALEKAPTDSFIAKLIVFLRKGAFEFAYDD